MGLIFGRNRPPTPPEPDYAGYLYGSIEQPVALADPDQWNYPPSTAGDTGIKTVPTPKGLAAPRPQIRPDVILDQRLTERMQTFAPRHPYQQWLRQEKVVMVQESTTPANHFYASGYHYDPVSTSNDNTLPSVGHQVGYVGSSGPATTGDAQVGPMNPGGGSGGASSGGQSRYSSTASEMGMYARDYTQQTQMGAIGARFGQWNAPDMYLSIPGINDFQAQVIVNGQYSQINGNLAGLYTNLRAPSPFEGMGIASCQS